jgi:hypothetical protein
MRKIQLVTFFQNSARFILICKTIIFYAKYITAVKINTVYTSYASKKIKKKHSLTPFRIGPKIRKQKLILFKKECWHHYSTVDQKKEIIEQFDMFSFNKVINFKYSFLFQLIGWRFWIILYTVHYHSVLESFETQTSDIIDFKYLIFTKQERPYCIRKRLDFLVVAEATFC